MSLIPKRTRAAGWLALASVLTLILTYISTFLLTAAAHAADDDKPTKSRRSEPAAESEQPAGDARYAVPDGSPEELLTFINEMAQSKHEVKGARALLDHKLQSRRAIVEAAERINQSQADGKLVAAALKAEAKALAMLKRLRDKEAGDKLDRLLKDIENDPRPGVADVLRYQELEDQLDRIGGSNAAQSKAFVDDYLQLLSRTGPSTELAAIAQQGLVSLYQADKKELAIRLATESAKAFAADPQGEMAALGVELAQLAGTMFERENKESEAAKWYREFAEQLEKSDDPQVKKAAESFLGLARKYDLLGHPMEIAGKQLEGDDFDLSKYKGKVVLVDFWATWCGPCIGELPNVKETYEKYHDRGFEVVGISLDSDRDRLEEFIEKEKLPWPILFEGGEETSGWNHPLARHYGVNAIPMAVLINREGNVVTLSARGKQLGELVSELVGEDEKE
jgi:thiol-disulfide isomerase/thioredoxin